MNTEYSSQFHYFNACCKRDYLYSSLLTNVIKNTIERMVHGDNIDAPCPAPPANWERPQAFESQILHEGCGVTQRAVNKLMTYAKQPKQCLKPLHISLLYTNKILRLTLVSVFYSVMVMNTVMKIYIATINIAIKSIA